MARTSRWLCIVGAFVALAGCGVDKSTTYWEDAFCADPPEDTPPVVSTAFVGLFLEDGTPLCRDDATVTLEARPSPYGGPVSLMYSTTYFARVTDDWAMHMFSGGDGPCNVYAPATANSAWRRCDPPLQYAVRVEGCEPVGGTFTWNDNWFPWKNPYSLQDKDWLIPVRMRCSGPPPDASVPPDASISSDGSTP